MGCETSKNETWLEFSRPFSGLNIRHHFLFAWLFERRKEGLQSDTEARSLPLRGIGRREVITQKPYRFQFSWFFFLMNDRVIKEKLMMIALQIILEIAMHSNLVYL